MICYINKGEDEVFPGTIGNYVMHYFDTIVLSPDALTYRGGHQVCTYVLLYYL